jgi:transcription initiation factor IIE alpha subunit
MEQVMNKSQDILSRLSDEQLIKFRSFQEGKTTDSVEDWMLYVGYTNLTDVLYRFDNISPRLDVLSEIANRFEKSLKLQQ